MDFIKKKKKVTWFAWIMLIIVLFTPISALATPIWAEIGGGPVSSASAGNVRIAISGGDVYCAYLDASKPTVKKADGTSWTGGLVTDCFSFSIDIETNPSNDRIYVAHYDNVAQKTYVKEYIDGTGWQQVGGEVFAKNGDMLDLEFIGNVPYLAFRPYTNYNAYVFKLDGANWTQVGTPVHAATTRALALTSYNGNPVVCYADNSYTLYAKKWNPDSSAWEAMSVSSPGQIHSSYSNIDIVMVGSEPYVAYSDLAGAAYVKKTTDAINWTTVGTGLPTSGVGNYSMAKDGNTIYLALGDQIEAKLYTYDTTTSTEWTRVTGSISVGLCPSGAFNMKVYNGSPYIGFGDRGGTYSDKARVKAYLEPKSDDDSVADDKAALELTFGGSDSAASVTQNLTLDATGDNGTTISWASSNTSFVAANGTATRPTFTQGDTAVTLTATISKGSASDTKTFNLTVKALAPTDAEAVSAQKSDLVLLFGGTDNLDNVTQNLTFDTSGDNGTTITWASSDTNFVATDGTVTRPTTSQGDKTIILTATITKGTSSDTKTFNVKVKAPVAPGRIEPIKSPVNAQISQSNAVFDVYNPQDIPVSLNSNGNSLLFIKNSETPLVQGQDYTMEGDIVTIKKQYLEKLPNGDMLLTFDFSEGIDQTLTITISGVESLAIPQTNDGRLPLGVLEILGFVLLAGAYILLSKQRI